MMYEMLYGIPPYYTSISRDALFHNIKHAKLTFPDKNIVSEDAKNLITKVY
jgi:hypothetical protein